jgi:hypothetical protein
MPIETIAPAQNLPEILEAVGTWVEVYRCYLHANRDHYTCAELITLPIETIASAQNSPEI